VHAWHARAVVDEVMRASGRAAISRDPALLGGMAVTGTPPKLAIVIALDEVFFHCGSGYAPPPGFGRRVGAPLQDIEIERVVGVRPRLAFDHIVNHPRLPVGAQGLCRSLPSRCTAAIRSWFGC